jgi:hypothetical protein
MLLKRYYDIPEGWEPKRAPDGTLLNPPKVDALDVRHTGTHQEQNFSRRLVDAGLAEGWLSLSKGILTLHTTQEDLTYTILRTPGLYCCHCDAALGEDASGAAGRAHVAAVHPGEPSPDAQHPAGYRHVHAYECVLDVKQHARWQRPAGATVSHWRGTAAEEKP